jgi:hypothetical protein
MARRTHTCAIRPAVEGGGQVKAELVWVGQSGLAESRRSSSSTRSRRSTHATAHAQVSVDFPASRPTMRSSRSTTLDDSSEAWDLIPMMEFLLENTTDPNRISFLVTNV